jgi:hypothetical protein
MFKLLNPYQMLSQNSNMPIDNIELGRTPELSRFHWSTGDTQMWLNWRDFSRRIIIVSNARTNKKESISVGHYLFDVASWLKGELNMIKSSVSLPWHPEDPVRKWLLPYVKVSNMDELRAMLDEDIALMQNTLNQD